MIKVLDFYADWCAPCKVMRPIFDELKEEYSGEVGFESIDVEANGSMASQYRVMSIPTFVIIKNEEEISRKLGAVPKEALKSWIEGNL